MQSSATAAPSIDQNIIPNNAPTLNVLIQMKNDNKSDYTINFTRKALNFLAKHTSLNEPEAVKHFIAQLKTSNSYKRNLCIVYNKYCKFYKIELTMPLYLPEAKNIKLPTKEKLLVLIARAKPNKGGNRHNTSIKHDRSAIDYFVSGTVGTSNLSFCGSSHLIIDE